MQQGPARSQQRGIYEIPARDIAIEPKRLVGGSIFMRFRKILVFLQSQCRLFSADAVRRKMFAGLCAALYGPETIVGAPARLHACATIYCFLLRICRAKKKFYRGAAFGK